jgi:hypothetical protein
MDMINTEADRIARRSLHEGTEPGMDPNVVVREEALMESNDGIEVHSLGNTEFDF